MKTNPRYWNMVESGVKYYEPNQPKINTTIQNQISK